MAGQLATGLFSAAGSVLGAQDQAAVAKANAVDLTREATGDELAAKANAQSVERETARTLGQAQANAAASGVQLSGSPLAVMHSIANQGELSRRLTVFNGQLAAKGALTQAAQQRAQASEDLTAGWVQGASTVLSSIDKGANARFPETMASIDSFGLGS